MFVLFSPVKCWFITENFRAGLRKFPKMQRHQHSHALCHNRHMFIHRLKIQHLPVWLQIVTRVGIGVVVLTIAAWSIYQWHLLQQKVAATTGENQKLISQISQIKSELDTLKNEDQYVKNQQLIADINTIESAYRQAVNVYEDLLRLKEASKNTGKFDETFADVLTLLTKRNYVKAAITLTALHADIDSEQQRIAASFIIPQNVPENNVPPPSGYSRQSVNAEGTNYLVDIIAGDLSSTRIIVDTASNETCTRDCPVLSLSDYVSRNGAYAGVNGSYFCPSDYPSCADKKNSFDTLLMNKNKVYFNSDNNKYSTVPAVIFGSGFIRFVGQSLEWGRDTSIDSMIANQPLLVSGGSIVFGGNQDPKMGSAGSRGFVANRGNTVYIGVVHNVTVVGMARVLKIMGMENALNLDSGGSVALWVGGYKVGPGRNIPNAVLFVRK